MVKMSQQAKKEITNTIGFRITDSGSNTLINYPLLLFSIIAEDPSARE
jgi:hypothetical protein